jgi:hypothetical protein
VLRHPDQASGWLIVVAATIDDITPVGDAPDRLTAAAPLTSARLRTEVWHQGDPTEVIAVRGDPLRAPQLWRPLQLDREPPVRLVLGDGGRLALAAHHAAFDGLSLLHLLVIAAGLLPETDGARGAGGAGRTRGRLDVAAGLLRRLARPADPVAPSSPEPQIEARVWTEVQLSGPAATARLATAVAGAVAVHNQAGGHPWSRIGISIGVAGERGIGNLASYRRVDVGSTGDVAPAVQRALAGSAPPELAHAPRWLRHLRRTGQRMGDSFLVSNLGRRAPGGLVDPVFFPVARGPSAVAVGAVATADGRGSLSLRARHLNEADASALLDAVVEQLRAV